MKTKTIIIDFVGELDGTNITEYAKIVNDALTKDEHNSIILNFHDLRFINSTAIGHIMQWYNQITEQGNILVIAEPNEDIKDILDLVGLSTSIEMFDVMQRAEEYVASWHK